MTGKEMIEFIKENDLLDYEIAIKYRDEGGEYMGEEMIDEVYYIDKENRILTL